MAALSKPETADVTIGQSEERRKEIQKSKLAEDVKRKLLVQVILIHMQDSRSEVVRLTLPEEWVS